MARSATTTIPYATLKAECKKLGINSWPEYQKRFKEIAGAKKTLHASYKGEWKGNKEFFGNAVTIEKKAPSKKVPAKTASNAVKKAPAKKAAKKVPAAKKAAVKS